MSDPRPLSLAEAISALRSPYAMEEFSSLTGQSFLLVDLRGDVPGGDGESASRAWQTLAALPCPTIAIGTASEPERTDRWRSGFDVWLEGEDDLAILTETIRTHPIASLAMVQLLRHNENLSVHDGLLAESLVYSTLQSGPEFANWLQGRKPASDRGPDDTATVEVLRDGTTVHITLNRPQRHNAFSAQMRDALAEALLVVNADPSIEQVILRGAGASFCSGGDLDEFGTLPDPATAHVIRSTRNPARLLAHCANRVLCEVHGVCAGAGVELPAFTTRVRAKHDAVFWLPEISMGLVPGAGGTVSLPRRIGRHRTNFLALSGKRIDPECALRWGLVDELVD